VLNLLREEQRKYLNGMGKRNRSGISEREDSKLTMTETGAAASPLVPSVEIHGKRIPSIGNFNPGTKRTIMNSAQAVSG